MTTDTFRQDVRSWLEANCPASIRTPMPQDEMPGGGRRARYKNPDTKLWLDRRQVVSARARINCRAKSIYNRF